LIFNGIDTNKFKREVKEKAIIDRNIIGMISRLVPVKAHKTMINAMKLVTTTLADAELWIIGDGPLKEELTSFCVAEGLHQVKFLGARRDVVAILQQLKVLVLSSIDEGMSITLLEAMASGVPVVATNVGGNPEIVVDGETGFLVEPESSELLAAKVIRLLADRKLAGYMGENGIRRVQEYFSIEKMTREYEKIYDSVL
jgi:glycosyltransferase involved in cell wall biosynthesis